MAGAGALEREGELAPLGAAGELRTGGRGGAVLVEGRRRDRQDGAARGGARRGAATGADVLRARGSELEAGLAFGGVRQLFGAARAARRRRASARSCSRAGRRWPPPCSDSTSARRRGTALADPLYGLYWLAAGLAERAPLVLGDRRPALARRGVRALRRLPRPAPGRRCRCSLLATARARTSRVRRTSRRGAARRAPRRPARGR